MTTATINKDIYKNLGYLFYGLATSGRPMDSDSLDLLKKTVHRQWDMNRSHLPSLEPSDIDNVDTLFDWLLLNETPAEDCIREFSQYMRIHHGELSEEFTAFIKSANNAVAATFGTQPAATIPGL